MRPRNSLSNLNSQRMSHRLANIFFFFSLIFVFVLFCKTGDQIRIGIAFSAAVIFCFIAFILNWLTLDGTISAMIFGTIAYGLGGVIGALVVLGFFVSSSIISKDVIIGDETEHPERRQFRRNGNQVWANGFWFVFFTFLWFITQSEIFLLAATGSMAGATADTWATEIGSGYKPGTTRLLHNFREVHPGTDGGVSFKGLIAAISGSVFISGIYWIFSDGENLPVLIALAIAGFLGSLADSWAGAKIQGTHINTPKFLQEETIKIDNDFVNWIGTGSASIITILLIQFI